METIHDVLRQLVKLLGGGADHDKAVEIIDARQAAEAAKTAAAPEPPASSATPVYDQLAGTEGNPQS